MTPDLDRDGWLLGWLVARAGEVRVTSRRAVALAVAGMAAIGVGAHQSWIDQGTGTHAVADMQRGSQQAGKS